MFTIFYGYNDLSIFEVLHRAAACRMHGDATRRAEIVDEEQKMLAINKKAHNNSIGTQHL